MILFPGDVVELDQAVDRRRHTRGMDLKVRADAGHIQSAPWREGQKHERLQPSYGDFHWRKMAAEARQQLLMQPMKVDSCCHALGSCMPNLDRRMVGARGDRTLVPRVLPRLGLPHGAGVNDVGHGPNCLSPIDGIVHRLGRFSR